MTTILFQRTHYAYLPEINAYKKYLSQFHPDITVAEAHSPDDAILNQADIIWRFPGLDHQGKGKFIVHEYNSLSTGYFPLVKNALKTFINAVPHRRIFLNEEVEKGFGFSDSVPFRLRDMGIDQSFFTPYERKKTYDFVYVGSLNRGKILVRVLDRLASLREAKVLLIGSAPEAIKRRYQHHKNIIFAGEKPYEEIAPLACQASYALNVMPDRYPFNLQTATKVLEYCALGLPIVTTRYRWIEDFARKRSAKFYWLNSIEDLALQTIREFPFCVPSVEDLEWTKIIGKSKIFDFL